MSVGVQKRAATNLASIATRIPGARVAMGLAWRCGNWCPGVNDLTGNRSTELAEDELPAGQGEPRDAVREVLAVVLRSGADGSPSAVADDLADAHLGYLAACGYRIVHEQEITGGRNG